MHRWALLPSVFTSIGGVPAPHEYVAADEQSHPLHGFIRRAQAVSFVSTSSRQFNRPNEGQGSDACISHRSGKVRFPSMIEAIGDVSFQLYHLVGCSLLLANYRDMA